jgi:uncharacterized metal-binding protein YceD (DUF177 family)
MIAPAMNSRTDGALTYQSLGQRKALVERVVRSEQMSRLEQECTELGNLQVKLYFNRDARYRVVVEGVIEASAKLPCHLCQESVPYNLRTTFNATIASTEEQAEYWSSGEESADLNIVVIEGPRLDIVELVEDELLLDLPGQVCVDLNCGNRPAMVYDDGASDAPLEQRDQKDKRDQKDLLEETEELVDRQLPFLGLKAALQEIGSLPTEEGEEDI